MGREVTLNSRDRVRNIIIFIVLVIIAAAFLFPLAIVFMNSFKNKLNISSEPFAFPTGNTFAGFSNYTKGLVDTNFFEAFGYSLFITVFSVIVIIFFTSMTAWYITRIKNKWTKLIYYSFAFSMIVPFQMVMFTMSKMANILRLDNPIGIVLVYLGFGAGLSTFMLYGFAQSLPISIEEAAMIDGAGVIRMFFTIICPMMMPIMVTVAILNTMWIWNDYLLPKLVIGSNYMTIPIAIQYLKGGYGSIDMGAMMAMLVLAIIPIIIFYAFSQKYIIEGVVAGAVKG